MAAVMKEDETTTARRSSIMKENNQSMLGAPNMRRQSRRQSRLSDIINFNSRKLSLITPHILQGSSSTNRSPSLAGLKLHKPNTYKLQPADCERFNAADVEKIMAGILETYLVDENYDSKTAPMLTKKLTDIIKSQIKELNMPRYKLICIVHISEEASQGIMISSRCLWNTDTDNYASAMYRNSSLYALAATYALYCE